MEDWSEAEVKQWLHAEHGLEMPKEMLIDGKSLLKLSVADVRTIWGLSLHDGIVFIEKVQRLRHHLVQKPVVMAAATATEEDDDVPIEYLCPITQEVMVVPVLCPGDFFNLTF